MEAALARGELYLRDPEVGSSRCVKRYLEDVKGIPLQDIWDEVGRMKGGTDYPTQKPDRLVERIVNIGSKEGDLVADFFCGSGTTAAVAEKLGRNYGPRQVRHSHDAQAADSSAARVESRW